MRLKSLDLQLDWPEALLIQDLRIYVLDELRNFGNPIRWAITSISPSKPGCSRKLTIEAVVIIT